MQLPVICSDIIGNTDIITQQKTGLIFPVKDVAVLKEALEFAFVKQDKMAQFAANLYLEALKNYSREAIHQEILETYYQKLGAVAHAE